MANRLSVLAAAWLLAILHPVVTLTILFGWMFDILFYIYGSVLFLTLLSWMWYGSCVLSEWEFVLRKKLEPELPEYEHAYIHYHLRKVFNRPPSKLFIRRIGTIFISLSLLLWINNLMTELGWYTITVWH